MTPDLKKLHSIIDGLDAISDDYLACHHQLVELRHEFHEAVAAILEPRLQGYLSSLPCSANDEKRSLASWANGQCNALGLAIRNPKTDLPGILVADMGAGRSTCRFSISTTVDRKQHRSRSWAALPPLELIEDAPRIEVLAKWADRVADSARTRIGRSRSKEP